MRGGGRRVRHQRRANPCSTDDQSSGSADSAVSKVFLDYKALLDSKHDKHEALVKISRDVTIESKRIIFHLHRCVGGDKEKILLEAEQMIDKCIKVQLCKMAEELKNVDRYQHARAITAGLQEFIEAYTFYMYIKEKTLPSIEDVRNRLKFVTPSDIQLDVPRTEDEGRSEEAVCADISTSFEKPMETNEGSVSVPLSQMDFILGIADLTGELMRMSINSIGWGDVDLPVELCTVLQLVEMAFHTYCSSVRGEMNRKIQTLKQSVAKVENACYTVKIRGSEIPKHMLVHTVETNEKLINVGEMQASYNWL